MLASNIADPVFEKLSSTAFAAELTPAQCMVLSSIMTARTLSRGQVLFRENDRDDTLHVVVKGSLAVIKTANSGEETLSFVKEGGLAGAMGFIDGQAHSAELRATADTEVLSLSRSKLEQLLDSDPHLVYAVMRSIIRSVHSIVRHMNDQYVQLTSYISRHHGRY